MDKSWMDIGEFKDAAFWIDRVEPSQASEPTLAHEPRTLRWELAPSQATWDLTFRIATGEDGVIRPESA